MNKTIEQLQQEKQQLESDLRNLITKFADDNPGVYLSIEFAQISQELTGRGRTVTNNNVKVNIHL